VEKRISLSSFSSRLGVFALSFSFSQVLFEKPDSGSRRNDEKRSQIFPKAP
jgi:hypothetical protein